MKDLDAIDEELNGSIGIDDNDCSINFLNENKGQNQNQNENENENENDDANENNMAAAPRAPRAPCESAINGNTGPAWSSLLSSSQRSQSSQTHKRPSRPSLTRLSSAGGSKRSRRESFSKNNIKQEASFSKQNKFHSSLSYFDMKDEVDRVDPGNFQDENEEEGDYSYSSFGSTLDSQIEREQNQQDQEDDIAKHETKHVCWLRATVITILFVATLVVSVIVFLALKRSDQQDFEVQFEAHATSLLHSFQDNMDRKLGALETLAVAITSYGLHQQDSSKRTNFLPTLPHFAVRAAATLQLGEAISINVLPIIQTQQQRTEWEQYTIQNSQWLLDGLIYDAGNSTISYGYGSTTMPPTTPTRRLQQDAPDFSKGVASHIFTIEDVTVIQENGFESLQQRPLIDQTDGPWTPIWQQSPVTPFLTNYNLISNPDFQDAIQQLIQSEQAVLGRTNIIESSVLDSSLGREIDAAGIRPDDPFTTINFPIFDSFESDRKLAGLLSVSTYWNTYFQNELPEKAVGIHVIVENECGQASTWIIDGVDVSYLGEGRIFDSDFDYLQMSEQVITTNSATRRKVVSLDADFCPYKIRVYPSNETREYYTSNKPQIYTGLVVVLFVATAICFAVYDFMVERRQKMVMKSAIENRAIVSSLFPSAVRERLYREEEATQQVKSDQSSMFGGGVGAAPKISAASNNNDNGIILGLGEQQPMSNGSGGDPVARKSSQPNSVPESARLKIKNFVNSTVMAPFPTEATDPYNGGQQSAAPRGDLNGASTHTTATAIDARPIADLFPHCTVFFADIAGFTAWSSQREPTQVFTLLQTLYQNFDKYAKRLVVFKVETIGDCYLAVTGLPEPQPDHAVRMARFARECLSRMKDLTGQLESTLGPDTADLNLRVGLHSGPVTAGVLRGEKSRFQLFGDTVNTAARMESTGKPAKIQCSAATAKLLREANKGQWLSEREDVVVAKGKGEMVTFWISTRGKQPRRPSASSAKSTNTGASRRNGSVATSTAGRGGSGDDDDSSEFVARQTEIDDQEKKRIKQERLISWHVETLSRILQQVVAFRSMQEPASSTANPPEQDTQPSGRAYTDEFANVISFPEVSSSTMPNDAHIKPLDSKVTAQLKDYVTNIATLYRGDSNPFHNFDHATHTTLAMSKFLSRFVRPVLRSTTDHATYDTDTLAYVSRITCNPLVQFAALFATLIHDVDHDGVTNAQLMVEQGELVTMYNGQSMLEQNSLDVAWELLMDESYTDLRAAIYETQQEFKLFRQVVVNMVLATDLFDDEFKRKRLLRWENAFETDNPGLSSTQLENLRATVVLEYTMQACDIVHTMQHWLIFKKWNEMLYKERKKAFDEGRSCSTDDPVANWFEEEIEFFDNFVIPISGKLLDSKAFEVAGEECVNYAIENCVEWAAKGIAFVTTMSAKHSTEPIPSDTNATKLHHQAFGAGNRPAYIARAASVRQFVNDFDGSSFSSFSSDGDDDKGDKDDDDLTNTSSFHGS